MPQAAIIPGTLPPAPQPDAAYYPALDGIRAIAFLMVFFQHYVYLAWGFTGVNVFFVLSGFLITGILFDSRDQPHRARNFYARRTLRIFPLYYGIMLAILLAWPFMHWRLGAQWWLWPAYLGNYARFLHPATNATSWQLLGDFQLASEGHRRFYLGHFWSLCVEEQFYLIWPWVVFNIRSRRALLWLCLLAVPLCLAARIAGTSLFPAWMITAGVLQRTLPFCLDALLTGAVLALLLRGPHASLLLQSAQWLFPLVCLVLICGYAIFPGRHNFTPDLQFPAALQTWIPTLINLSAGVLILVAVQTGSLAQRVLSWAPLRSLGRISYGAYVFHDILHLQYIHLAQILFRSHWQLFAVPSALVLTILMAALSYRFFEMPFLRLKRFFPSGRTV